MISIHKIKVNNLTSNEIEVCFDNGQIMSIFWPLDKDYLHNISFGDQDLREITEFQYMKDGK